MEDNCQCMNSGLTAANCHHKKDAKWIVLQFVLILVLTLLLNNLTITRG